MAVSRDNVQVTLNIPKRLNDDQRILLAELAIEEIINRTTVKKVDVNTRAFKPYSESYKESLDFKQARKGKKPNLKLTGEMVHSIELIEHGVGYITLGFDPSSDIAGRVEGNQIGSYGKSTGNPDKERKFLGLPIKTIKILVAKVESRTISRRIKAESELIDNILARITNKDVDDA